VFGYMTALLRVTRLHLLLLLQQPAVPPTACSTYHSVSHTVLTHHVTCAAAYKAQISRPTIIRKPVT
jgi:hypothetical protein